MSFTKLREIRDRFEQQWINGGFIFGYENEINENHNNDYPLLVVLPPTSELPATEGDVQEEYTFECLITKPYYQNQSGSLDVVFSLLEQEGLTWLQRVLDSYTSKEVILSPDSISVEREKELYNDKLIQVRLTFTLNTFSHSFLATDEALVMSYNPKVWLKADMGVKTEFFGGNEVVNKWIDQSGNGNHFVQTTSTAKPIYKYENTDNGYPFLEFDGSNDFMSCINNSIDGSNGLNHEYTIIWVAKPTSETNNSFLSKNGDITNTQRINIELGKDGSSVRVSGFLHDPNNKEIDIDADFTYGTSAVGLDFHNKGFHLFANQTQIDTRTKGSWLNTTWYFGNTSPIMLGTNKYISPTNFFQGNVQELMIFSHDDVTHDQVKQINRYLQHKYKI